MPAVKLRDVLHTRYITEDHVSLMCDVFDKNDEVDLAGCKLMPGAMQALRRYYGKIKLVNSENDGLNKLLEHNMNAVKTKVDSVVLNPSLAEPVGIFDFFNEFDRSLVYKLDLSVGVPKRNMAIAVIMILRMPAVKIDLASSTQRLFEYVRSEWLKKRHSHYDKYWLVRGDALLEIPCVDNKVKLFDGLIVEEQDFASTYCTLPYDFGTEDVYERDDFIGMRNTAFDDIEKSFKKVKTMKNYIEIAEE